MNLTDNSSFEIDVFALLRRLWDRKWLITFVALLFGLIALVISAFVLPKEYTASTRVYVVNNNNQSENAVNYQDIQAGSYLVNDYKEIIKSDDVINQVIRDEKLNLSPSELSQRIRVDVPTDTRLITISVEGSDAKESSRLANAVRDVAIDKIKEVTKVEDVTVAETAKVPTMPTSPNIKRNLIIGVLAGAFMTIVILIVFEALDDRIKTGEDVERTLNRTLLGVVPIVNDL